MIKKVNVAARTPVVVSSLPAPIRGNVRNINLNEQDIFKCITQKAIVDEVLSNGSLVRLSLSNYNKVNEVVKPEPVVEVPTPVVEVAPVVEPAVQIAETVTEEEAVFDAAPVEEPTVESEHVEAVVEAPVEEVEVAETVVAESEEETEEKPKYNKKKRR